MNKKLADLKKMEERVTPEIGALIAKHTRTPKAVQRSTMRSLLVPLDPDVHKALKRLAIELDDTLEGVGRKAIANFLKKHGC